MLLAIRSKSQSWVMWVIVILLIIPFALWGVHEYFGGGGDVVVAEVDGRELSAREFENTYQRQRQRLQMMLEGRGSLSDLDQKQLRAETLQSMIDEEVVVQAALAGGFRVGDEQLAAAIRQLDVFQEDGRFSQQRYDYWIANMGYSPSGFEQTLRRNMLRAQLRQGLLGSALVTDRSLAEANRLAEQQRSFGVMLVGLEAMKDPSAVTRQDIEAYYRNNAADFTIPERVVVRYVELSKEQIAESIDIGEEEARRNFENFKRSYVAPEQRRASHILLTVPPGADGDAIEAVRLEAEEIRRRIAQGEDFAALARAHSDDAGSAAVGGDLGYFERGATVPLLDEPLFPPAFEEAVFAMEEGEISAPVRSREGFHIIRLEDVKDAGVASFEDVRDQVVADMRSTRAEQRFYEQAEQFANLVYEHVDTLEVVADSLGLAVRTSAPFPRTGGEGIAAYPRVVTAAFSEDVAQGMNSEPIEVEPMHLVAVRLEERIAPTLQPLAEVEDDIRERLVWEAARQRAMEKGEALMTRLRQGAEGRVLARQEGFEWQEVAAAGRRSDEVGEQVIDKVFRMEHPGGGSTVDGLSLADGDFAIIVLEAVEEGGEISKEAAERRRQVLAEMQGEEQFEALVEALRERTEITINRPSIDLDE